MLKKLGLVVAVAVLLIGSAARTAVMITEVYTIWQVKRGQMIHIASVNTVARRNLVMNSLRAKEVDSDSLFAWAQVYVSSDTSDGTWDMPTEYISTNWTVDFRNMYNDLTVLAE